LSIKCPKCQFDNPDDSKFCKECGTQVISSEEIPASPTKTLETPTKELTTGSTFAGRYQIIEELGKGGMGKVYKAHDTEIKEKVALKLINPEISADKKTIERFQNELKFARKISHRNVCRMYDLNKEEGTYYITMEYVPGEDLKSFLRRVGQLPAGKSISIAKQVCEGLSEAHRLGVVHRDLKPQNIMIDKEGNARIMDFGIARSLKAKGITGAGMMIGTPEYMSPEQVEGKDVDQRSDIYSVGVNLYEMVTGQVPFEGDTPFTIGMKHKGETPKDPKELNAQIPEDLSRVILRCLEKDREERYQTADELLSELTNIEGGIPTTERVVPKKKPITAREITVTVGLKKLFIPALVIAALIIIVLVIWQSRSQKEAAPISSDKPLLAIMYFQNNTGDGSMDIWRDGLSRMLIADISQSRYLRVLPDDQIYGILNKLNLLEAKNYSTEDLREVATRGGSTHILKGILTRSGDSFRINATLQQSNTMEIVDSVMVEGKGEGSLHTMVDELTRKIKESFKLSEEEIAGDIDSEVAKITTSSPEAYKLYSEGRKYHLQTDYWKSIGAMQKALKIDPEFAMAWRSIAMAFNNEGMMPGKRNALQKAFELSDRVSERERYIIHAGYYGLSEKTLDKAMEAFKKLLELYPDDHIGNNNLGLLYFWLEEFDKAVERYKLNIQNNPEDRLSPWNLIETYMAMGQYEKALETTKNYLAGHPDVVSFHSKIVQVYLFQGKYDQALDKLNEVLSLESESRLNYEIRKGDIYLLQGDLEKAEEQYKKLPVGSQASRRHLVSLYLYQGKFNEAKSQLLKKPVLHEPLAYLYLRSGNSEEALKEFDEVLIDARKQESLSWQAITLSAKGAAYLQMKSIDEALKIADEILELVQAGSKKKTIRYYHQLMGKIELEKNKSSRAISFLNKAVDSLYAPEENFPKVHVLFISTLAQAHFNAGNLNKAQENFERIHSLALGRLDDGDFYAKSFYMLGKIFEQLGKKAKAIEHYEKFLDLWKDADPGIAEVEDARKRLASLK
jgi:serine/threonine protein kinase/predicted Zn-dependent protease